MRHQSLRLFYSLLLFLYLSPTLNAQCGPDYLYKGVYNGHAYFISTHILDWEEAKSAATAMGGYLASITSAEENNFVATQVADGSLAWIGLSDAVAEGAFVWSSGESFGYSNWGQGEPNSAGVENWVEINRNAIGKWNDMPAGFPRRFVVEFDRGDTDADGAPDVCDVCPFDAQDDADGDGLCSDVDNCPNLFNPNQEDEDTDGEGDVCDVDADNDGCPDQFDANPLIFSEDSDCDGVADDCDLCPGADDNGPCSVSSFPGFDQLPMGWRCGADKVFVCQNGNTLCVSPNALPSYLSLGNFLGPCISCSLLQNFQFELFPNPVAEDLNVFINGLELAAAKLVFYDNLGRPVLERNIPSGLLYTSILIDVNEFPAGAYYVQLSALGSVLIKKLIVAR